MGLAECTEVLGGRGEAEFQGKSGGGLELGLALGTFPRFVGRAGAKQEGPGSLLGSWMRNQGSRAAQARF